MNATAKNVKCKWCKVFRIKQCWDNVLLKIRALPQLGHSKQNTT